ncbi:MAG: HAD-IC family P-type ATPase [Clostridia bacterium]|nr:HAD-IC family P-type ATPase [Clostridia bacterium]
MEKLKLNNEIDFNIGLTNLEVADRVKVGKVNTTLTKTSKSYAQIFIGNLCTWFNLVCFIIAGLLVAVNSFENITFLIIFLANLLIGLIQEIRAKRMVDKISVMYEAKTKVLRNGQKLEVDLNKVVVHDIVFFEAGNQICADCVVIEGNVEANESLITGESKPVKKKAGDTLLGGSFIISGECKAQAIKVGLETYSSSLIKKAREFKNNQSDILKTLNFIIKTIGILLIPLGILTFVDAYKTAGLRESVIKASGSIIGMMPVGMFLLTSVSLVVGVLKLAKKKTLVQDLYSIETLARVNVLCLDKTGTITDGTMSVTTVLPINAKKQEIKDIMHTYLASFGANNQTQIALRDYFGAKKKSVAESVIPFSSERKFSAATIKDLGTFMLGAPEFVTNNLSDELKTTIKEFTSNGYRVLVLCKNKNKIKKDTIEIDNEPISIIVIQDNIRPDAMETIKWFNENDVTVKIISGDNVDTVSSISKKVGVEGAEKCISLEGKTEEEVKVAALKYNIFGRVTPEQKCIIVKTLKENGNKVAMTGDGVNDILALKEADCSIAMASGSEATRSASNLVMLENNFSSMPSIVAEGRRVITNISKASSLFLTKTFFTMFLTIFVLISPTYVFPLQSNQILLWETLFIGIPAFFLALQPNDERVKGSFIASLTSKALPGALVLFLASMACYIYCAKTGNMEAVATMISYCVTLGAFFILLNLCLPLDKFRSFVCFGLLLICSIAFFILPNNFFNYVELITTDYAFILIICSMVYLLYALFKRLFELFFSREFVKKIINKNKKEQA